MSRDCCVALPRGVMGLSAVCDCGISWSYSLFIYYCNISYCTFEFYRQGLVWVVQLPGHCSCYFCSKQYQYGMQVDIM